MAEGWDGRSRNGSALFRTALGEWKERIIIQKSRTGTDKAGNHILSWEEYYSCAACVNNLSGKEYWEAVLLKYGIFYGKREVWIESERLYEVLYEMEV